MCVPWRGRIGILQYSCHLPGTQCPCVLTRQPEHDIKCNSCVTCTNHSAVHGKHALMRFVLLALLAANDSHSLIAWLSRYDPCMIPMDVCCSCHPHHCQRQKASEQQICRQERRHTAGTVAHSQELVCCPCGIMMQLNSCRRAEWLKCMRCWCVSLAGKLGL